MCKYTYLLHWKICYSPWKEPPVCCDWPPPSAVLNMTHSKAAFCVNLSVVAPSDKQRNVGVVCIYVFLFMFVLSGCVPVCRLCTIKGYRMSEYLYLRLQYFGFALRNTKFLLNFFPSMICGHS